MVWGTDPFAYLSLFTAVVFEGTHYLTKYALKLLQESNHAPDSR